MMKPYPIVLQSLLTVLTSLLVMLVNVTDRASVLCLVGAVKWKFYHPSVKCYRCKKVYRLRLYPRWQLAAPVSPRLMPGQIS